MALILLAALFIGMPLLEIAVFIQVGSAIGVWPTIALTVATTLAGSLLLRAQGLATLLRARAQMDKGELPAREMFEGVCLVLAGGLLTVPGFVTDTLGLLLFIPPVRHLLRLLIAHHLAAKVASGEARIFVGGVRAGPRGPHARQPGRDGEVIEGDYEDVTDAEERRDSQEDRRADRRLDGPRTDR
ncbi:MAG TPA: FxsA family protein [Kiloniellaceae bacterium]